MACPPSMCDVSIEKVEGDEPGLDAKNKWKLKSASAVNHQELVFFLDGSEVDEVTWDGRRTKVSSSFDDICKFQFLSVFFFFQTISSPSGILKQRFKKSSFTLVQDIQERSKAVNQIFFLIPMLSSTAVTHRYWR